MLLLPEPLSHLPATPKEREALANRFTNVVTEIHTLDPAPSPNLTASPLTRQGSDAGSRQSGEAGRRGCVRGDDPPGRWRRQGDRPPAAGTGWGPIPGVVGDVDTALVFRPVLRAANPGCWSTTYRRARRRVDGVCQVHLTDPRDRFGRGGHGLTALHPSVPAGDSLTGPGCTRPRSRRGRADPVRRATATRARLRRRR